MTKQITITVIVALVISLVVGFSIGGKTTVIQTPTDQSNVDLGSVRQIADSYPNGVTIGTQSQNVIEGRILGGDGDSTAADSDTQWSWKNTTGRAVFASARAIGVATSSWAFIDAVSTTGGIASSTLRLIAGTSTSATISDYPTLTTSNSGLLSWLIATSTAANSMVGSTTDSIWAGSSTKNPVVMVQPNEYVNFLLMQTGPVACANAGCLVATSTERGYNLRLQLRTSYDPI